MEKQIRNCICKKNSGLHFRKYNKISEPIKSLYLDKRLNICILKNIHILFIIKDKFTKVLRYREQLMWFPKLILKTQGILSFAEPATYFLMGVILNFCISS